MNQDIADRLQIILNQKSLSASAFADEISVQRSNISHILSRRSKPSLDFIEKMCARFPDIDISWFISGKAAASTRQRVAEEPAQRDLFGMTETILVEEHTQEPEHVHTVAQTQEPAITAAKNYEEKPQKERSVTKIITFFSDNSFQEFTPAPVL
ncbi:MAG: helix-turn-helix domain-containing protein [Bacteroidales bacterium]|jgi:transcriptional regulator with XRE-family HTH domain|nr:helix-turn-helix domain-containing protein [Bacteroidales bacterium]